MIRRWLLIIELLYCSTRKELILRYTNALTIRVGIYQKDEINMLDYLALSYHRIVIT